MQLISFGVLCSKSVLQGAERLKRSRIVSSMFWKRGGDFDTVFPAGLLVSNDFVILRTAV